MGKHLEQVNYSQIKYLNVQLNLTVLIEVKFLLDGN